MIRKIKKLAPRFLVRTYHYSLALAANFFYGRPSEKLIVIGVAGTSGKSTVIHLVSNILEMFGYRVGVASTISFKIAKKEWLNDKKMTMLGRFALQGLIKQMVKKNCQYAIIETTSEGIEQFRHLGINYDILIFTNLYEEHIESHGSFENYKNAKLKLFKKLQSDRPKLIAGQKIKKTIITNLDNEHSNDFINNWAEEKIGFTTSDNSLEEGRVVRAENIAEESAGLTFTVEREVFTTKIYGRHNVYNILAAICVGINQGLQLSVMAKHFTQVKGVPGRIEFIDEGQNFQVIVDYAFEPKAMVALYDAIRIISHKKIIHVLGGTGGGRDKSRRPKIGEIVGGKANYVIVTNEDPYDEDPMEIIKQVSAGVKSADKKIDENLFEILDRREAIKKAFSLAKKDDLVLITGKGSEQAIVVKNNKKIFWDDRIVAREELKNL